MTSVAVSLRLQVFVPAASAFVIKAEVFAGVFGIDHCCSVSIANAVSVLMLFMCTLHVGIAEYHASDPFGSPSN